MIRERFSDDFFDDTPLLRKVPVIGRFAGYNSRRSNGKVIYDREFETDTTFICVICREQVYHVLFEQDLYPRGRYGKDWVKTAQGHVGIYNNDEIAKKSRSYLQNMINREYDMISTELTEKFGHRWSVQVFERLQNRLLSDTANFDGFISFDNLAELLEFDLADLKHIVTTSLQDAEHIVVTENGIEIVDIDRIKELLNELRLQYEEIMREYDLEPELSIDEAFEKKRASLVSYFHPRYLGQKEDRAVH